MWLLLLTIGTRRPNQILFSSSDVCWRHNKGHNLEMEKDNETKVGICHALLGMYGIVLQSFVETDSIVFAWPNHRQTNRHHVTFIKGRIRMEVGKGFYKPAPADRFVRT